MYEDIVGPGGGIRGAVDGKDVRDPKKGDDHQQCLRSLPILMVMLMIGRRGGSQLRDHHPHDPDEKEHVESKDEDDGDDVDVLQIVLGRERTVDGDDEVADATATAISVRRRGKR